MEMTKEGNYKLEDWSIENVECKPCGWHNSSRNCHSEFTIEDGDIVKRKACGEFYYGFICEKCGNFVEIDENLIPDEIKEFCPQVAAKGSDDYIKLSDEEKELSKYL